MNIPDEAARRYPEDYKTIGGNAASRRDFTAGAQWARKEALREAAAAIRNNAGREDENGICEGVSNWPEASARTYSFAAHEAIEAVHALAEGHN